MSPTILVAGVGNLLRHDDGFGIAVVERLAARDDLPPGVRVVETGIGGVGLVQELMDGFDVLLVLDAVRRGGRPGTLYLLEPEVADLETWTAEEKHTFLADLHRAEPSRALILARALGVLPPRVLVLGCEPADCEEAIIGVSEPVERAAALAETRVIELMADLAHPPVDDRSPVSS